MLIATDAGELILCGLDRICQCTAYCSNGPKGGGKKHQFHN